MLFLRVTIIIPLSFIMIRRCSVHLLTCGTYLSQRKRVIQGGARRQSRVRWKLFREKRSEAYDSDNLGLGLS